MNHSTTKQRTPEEEELARKQEDLAYLETEMAQGELDLATFLAELQAFESRYLRIVGTRMADLDEIEAEMAEIQARQRPNDARAQRQAASVRAQARESAQARETAQEAGQLARFEPSPELKALFRDLAKRIHPDLSMDEHQLVRRTTLMAEANIAYRRGDAAGLERILNEWESAPEAVQGEGMAAELVRVIRMIAQVRRRLETIETETAYLRQSDLHQLKLAVEDAQAAAHDLLAEMATELDARMLAAGRHLELLKFEEPIA